MNKKRGLGSGGGGREELGVLPLVAYVKNENCNLCSANIYLVSRDSPFPSLKTGMVGRGWEGETPPVNSDWPI